MSDSPSTWLRYPRFALWVADRDGLAHARLKSRSTRTLCGIVAIDQRYDWPHTDRCQDCKDVLDARPDR
jgi:hypothetical protein